MERLRYSFRKIQTFIKCSRFLIVKAKTTSTAREYFNNKNLACNNQMPAEIFIASRIALNTAA